MEKMNLEDIIKDEEVKKNLEIKLKKAKEIHIENILILNLKKSSNTTIKKWIENEKVNKIGNKLGDNYDKIRKERLYFNECKK